jgi:hypothetical protein
VPLCGFCRVPAALTIAPAAFLHHRFIAMLKLSFKFYSDDRVADAGFARR